MTQLALFCALPDFPALASVPRGAPAPAPLVVTVLSLHGAVEVTALDPDGILCAARWLTSDEEWVARATLRDKLAARRRS